MVARERIYWRLPAEAGPTSSHQIEITPVGASLLAKRPEQSKHIFKPGDCLREQARSHKGRALYCIRIAITLLMTSDRNSSGVIFWPLKSTMPLA